MIWWLFKGTRENSWKAMTQWMWILNSWNFLSLIRKNIQDLPTRNTWYSWISRLTTQPSCLCLVHLPPPNVTPLRNTALLRETYIVNKPWSQGRLFLGGYLTLRGGVGWLAITREPPHASWIRLEVCLWLQRPAQALHHNPMPTDPGATFGRESFGGCLWMLNSFKIYQNLTKLMNFDFWALGMNLRNKSYFSKYSIVFSLNVFPSKLANKFPLSCVGMCRHYCFLLVA